MLLLTMTANDDPVTAYISDESCTEIMAALNEEQRSILLLRLAGFTTREIGVWYSVCHRTIERRFKRMREVVTETCHPAPLNLTD